MQGSGGEWSSYHENGVFGKPIPSSKTAGSGSKLWGSAGRKLKLLQSKYEAAAERLGKFLKPVRKTEEKSM